jgi:hypothetical protein
VKRVERRRKTQLLEKQNTIFGAEEETEDRKKSLSIGIRKK